MLIRKATDEDAEGIAIVHVDSWRTTYKGIVPDEYLEKLSYEQRKEMWEQSILHNDIFVAVDENNKVVGFAVGGKERSRNYVKFDGELYAIYILENYQGLGIGRLLVHAVMEHLSVLGFHSMLVWVLTDNKAKYFYEKIGLCIVDKKEIEIGGKKLVEVAYGRDRFFD